ncbi:MAG: Gfo/Idh/MocA family oxidoreductase [Isosphaeraceae bacterium]
MIKLGVVGNGGRGAWIAGLFRKHGGYEMHAVADYFPEVADHCGEALGVPRERRFSGLSGYKRVIDSGVDAVALEVPPYFLPEQAHAAASAGLHVYMAKPVAVDVPGCLKVEAAATIAAEKRHCFLVDYQAPTEPINQQIVQAVHRGKVGSIAQVATVGIGGGFADPPLTGTIESRLRKLIWVNDVALGGDYVVNYDIHAVDLALWVLDARPIAASGGSRICRSNPHGDSRDVCSVVLEYAGGLVHNHFSQALPNKVANDLSCRVHGTTGSATIGYWGRAGVTSPDASVHIEGSVENLYEAGAMRNIATFHRQVIEGRYETETVRRSVDGALATILAREAAARHARLTMDELLRENKRLEVDLRGLKA